MIKIENIYYMLSYAYRNPQMDQLKKSDIEAFEGILDLLIFLLIKGVSTQVKRGLIKDYIIEEMDLSSPKGKIEIAKTINRSTHMKKKLTCSFDEYTADILLNQIIKATLACIIKLKDISHQNKKMARKVSLYFSETSTISMKDISWNNIRFHKHNSNYRFLINLCFLIHNSLIMTEKDGNKKQAMAVDDQVMNRIYEKFVLEYYRKHFPELNANASYIRWNVDDDMVDFLPAMKTDITLEYCGKVLIIDTKYYSKMMQTNWLSDKKTIHSGNIYQIYTYVKNRDTQHKGNVSGMLLYARTEEDIAPNQKYEMDGNSIYVRSLDLGDKFDGIREGLDQIANDIMKG